MAETKPLKGRSRARQSGSGSTAARALRGLETDGVTFASERTAALDAPVEELLDILATSGLVEEQAARLAARHLGERELAELERISQAMQAPLLVRNVDEVTRLSREFHRSIYRAARRPHLLLSIEQLWDAADEQAAGLFEACSPHTMDVVFCIRSLLAACRARDASALGLLVRYESHQAAAAALAASRGHRRSTSDAPPRSRRQKTLRAADSATDVYSVATRPA